MNFNAIQLNLLKFKKELQLKKRKGVIYIYDPIRKRDMIQTPEEIVRQLTIQYLVAEKGFRPNKLAVEKMLIVNERNKRFDILAYDDATAPLLLVECKAPSISITESAFEQISSYNLVLRVPYLLVTNGVDSYCCKMDYEQNSFEFIKEVPEYTEVSS